MQSSAVPNVLKYRQKGSKDMEKYAETLGLPTSGASSPFPPEIVYFCWLVKPFTH